VLALLAFGEYANVALGLNGLTLRVLGHVRYSVGVNVLTALAALAANASLVPSMGALGAGVATSGALVLHCVLKQGGLRIGTQVRAFDPRFASVYLAIAAGTAATLMVQWLAAGHPLVPLLTAGASSLALVVFSKRRLMVSETFPEVMRVPVLRALLA
jgi:O-antigen/teichoic acid export membrane protein